MCDTSLTTFQSLANAEKELNFLAILLIIHMLASLYFSVFVPWQILYCPKLRHRSWHIFVLFTVHLLQLKWLGLIHWSDTKDQRYFTFCILIRFRTKLLVSGWNLRPCSRWEMKSLIGTRYHVYLHVCYDPCLIGIKEYHKMHSHKDKVTDWYEIPCISSCLLWFMRCFGVRSSWCRRCRQSWTSHHSWSSSRCWMSRAFRPVAAWPPVIAAWSPGSTTTSSLDSPSLAMLLTALVNCWGNGVIAWHEGTCDLYSRSLLVVAEGWGQTSASGHCCEFSSVLWHCWFGDRNSVQSKKYLGHLFWNVLLRNEWAKKTVQTLAYLETAI